MTTALSDRPAAADRPSRLAAPLIRRLQAAYARHAAAPGAADAPAFTLTLPDGATHRFGAGEPAFAVIARGRPGVAALASLDETRVAEAYMAGSLDFEGDLLALLALRPLLSDRHPLQALWFKAIHPLVFGQVASDAKWIAEHYDEDPDFYGLFLDRERCYSHGLFAADDEPLDDAIRRKLDFALEAVGAQPGDRVLDIGAGWGAMTAHGGRRGVRITSLTISEPSERWVQELIDREDLPSRVLREHFLEHRLPPGEPPYDAIVNLGVTEHLPDYRASLAQYGRLLKPGGRVYLDACAARTKFPFSSFTYRHIFPGNATPLCLHEYLTEVAKTRFEVLAVHNDRHDYELTCHRWATALERGRPTIAARWGEGLFRRFQLYLWGCVDCFRRDLISAHRVVLGLPG
jgi:cyclopropane-fatty-acyl-phospholipid synthase